MEYSKKNTEHTVLNIISTQWAYFFQNSIRPFENIVDPEVASVEAS